MLRITPALPGPNAAPPRAARSGTGGFALMLPREGAGPSSAAIALAGVMPLFDAEAVAAEQPRRRRRAPQDVAQDGLAALAGLQRALLGGAEVPLAELDALAGEAEELAADPNGSICRAVALRLRIEIARREAR